MEIHGLAHLKSAILRTSTESGHHVLYAQEPISGRLTKLSTDLANALLKFKKKLHGEAVNISEEELQDLSIFSTYLDKIAKASVSNKARFNPLFANFSLFSPAPYQRYLRKLAYLMVSKAGASFLVLGYLLALWISSSTNFALVSEIGNVFSIDALLTFALMAPFLKIIHEFGHVLMATRYNVPVRDAGILMIALYPLPFVDCSEADFRAKRSGRIIISLGGLFADLSVALIVFFIWHITDNEVVRQICANIFVFNTLNTLVFNLNPLLKLDGYFALSDAFHRRNFYQEALETNRRFRGFLSRLSFKDAFALLRQQSISLCYSFLSMGYKIYILLFIIWTLVPQFFGLGLLITLWGGIVMFLVPALSEEKAKQKKGNAWKWRAFFFVLFLGIIFFPMKYRVTLPMALDIENAYQIRSQSDGVIVEQLAAGRVKTKDVLTRLQNTDLDTEISVARQDRELYSLLYNASRQSDPLGNEAAFRQLAGSEERLTRLETQMKTLSLSAKHAGTFWPLRDALSGVFMKKGSPVGILIPDTDESHLIGNFPEIYVEKFQQGPLAITLRGSDGAWSGLSEPIKVDLNRTAKNEKTGARGFLITAEVAVEPASAIKTSLQLQLTFAAEPLWKHAVFHYHRLRIEFLAKQDANNA